MRPFRSNRRFRVLKEPWLRGLPAEQFPDGRACCRYVQRSEACKPGEVRARPVAWHAACRKLQACAYGLGNRAPISLMAKAAASLRASPSTWWPADMSSATTADPMKPVAPVTNTRMRNFSRPQRGLARRIKQEGSTAILRRQIARLGPREAVLGRRDDNLADGAASVGTAVDGPAGVDAVDPKATVELAHVGRVGVGEHNMYAAMRQTGKQGCQARLLDPAEAASAVGCERRSGRDWIVGGIEIDEVAPAYLTADLFDALLPQHRAFEQA